MSDNRTMKSFWVGRYGGPEVVEERDIPRPEAGPGEVEVRVHATTVNSGDARLRAARFPKGYAILARLGFGIFAPRSKRPGMNFAGEISALGEEVEGFSLGERVFGSVASGAHADYVVIKADGPVAATPSNLTDEEAVGLIFGGTTALTFVHDLAQPKPGERVLVNGASGAVGVMAVQIAKLAGAEVSGVCSVRNEAFVKELGADHVIAYDRDALPAGQGQFDVVIDTIGTLGVKKGLPMLAAKGRLGLVVASIGEMLRAARGGKLGDGRRLFATVANESAHAVQTLAKLSGEGKIRPVIGKVFERSEMKAAHALVDTGHKRGAVVVRMTGPASAAKNGS